jgi:hypothetical protein
MDPGGRGKSGSPLPAYEELRSRSEELFSRDVNSVSGIDLRCEAQLQLIANLAQYDTDFDWPSSSTPGLRYYKDNNWFAEADAFTLYAVLRHLQPARLIEIGSGFSSALMLDTRDRFLQRPLQLTFVEPEPVRLRQLLRPDDCKTMEIIEGIVQRVPVARFRELQAGDVLFIDSSHVSRIGSDVNFLLFDVLPALAPGVVVHFHDIFWPFEYPKEWLMKGWAWNETYVVRAFLQHNSAFEVMLFGSYLVERHAEKLAKVPRLLRNPSSLWLRKVPACNACQGMVGS